MITHQKAIMTLISIFIWMIITCTPVSLGRVVLTQSGDQTVQAGKTVSITCKHDPAIDCYDTATKKKDCVSWYHQLPGETPKLLIIWATESYSGVPSRISGSRAGNKIDYTFTITGVQPEDSGVYYCQSQHFLNSTFSVFTQ
uniref:Ig-like domain-containing protein n=1 Tax=Pygocentrus nattereri TaxID=42514 RepID=A0AAR2JK29_PYGNA